jgi:hypothetical protein
MWIRADHFGAALLGLIVLSCDGSVVGMSRGTAPGQSMTTDEWVRFATGIDTSGFEAIPAERVASVLEARQAAAQEKLKTRAWLRLSREEAADYLKDPLPPEPSGAVPVLLRSVRPAPSDADDGRADHYALSWRGGVLLVRHSALCNRRMPQVRHALIALLPAEPRDVYVEELTAIRGLPDK